MNNTKIYGVGSNPDNRYNQEGGIQRFWRNIMGGCASARFHRPGAGLGLNETAQTHIKSARMLFAQFNVFTAEPRNDLLSNRSDNEAYLLTEVSKQYALYYPKDAGDGQVTLDLSDASGQWKVQWLNINESKWSGEQTLQGGKTVQIKKPDSGHWAALIVPHS